MTQKFRTFRRSDLIQLVVTAMRAELARSEAGRQDSLDVMRKAESAMQTRYGTEREEAEHLSAGHAMRSEELEASIALVERTHLKPDDVIMDGSYRSHIEVGCLIWIHEEGQPAEEVFLLLPAGGGNAITTELGVIRVVTPDSGIGQKLVCATAGETFHLHGKKPQQIISVY